MRIYWTYLELSLLSLTKKPIYLHVSAVTATTKHTKAAKTANLFILLVSLLNFLNQMKSFGSGTFFLVG